MSSVTNSTYRRLLYELIGGGSRTLRQIRRSMEINEIVCHTTRWPMSEPIVTIKGRKLNYGLLFAEAAQILSGGSNLNELTEHTSNMSAYSDDGILIPGAYGPRFVDQLPYILHCFKQDINTRQAVIQIWRAAPYESKNIACTLSIQFLKVDERLSAIVTMRSSDVFLGIPYDVFAFSMMAQYVIELLQQAKVTSVPLQLGTLYITAGSQHLYVKDLEAAERAAISNEVIPREQIIPIARTQLGSTRPLIEYLCDLAEVHLK